MRSENASIACQTTGLNSGLGTDDRLSGESSAYPTPGGLEQLSISQTDLETTLRVQLSPKSNQEAPKMMN
jgi:hypothetical protein